MFNNLGWSEIVVIVVAGLVILGPERIPGVVTSVMEFVKKIRNMTTEASEQLKEEFGPEFKAMKEPFDQINEIRNMNPQKLITDQLFNDNQPKNKTTKTDDGSKDFFDPDAT